MTANVDRLLLKNRLDMYSQKRKTLSRVIQINLNAGTKEPHLPTSAIYRYDPFSRYQDENTHVNMHAIEQPPIILTSVLPK